MPTKNIRCMQTCFIFSFQVSIKQYSSNDDNNDMCNYNGLYMPWSSQTCTLVTYMACYCPFFKTVPFCLVLWLDLRTSSLPAFLSFLFWSLSILPLHFIFNSIQHQFSWVHAMNTYTIMWCWRWSWLLWLHSLPPSSRFSLSSKKQCS